MDWLIDAAQVLGAVAAAIAAVAAWSSAKSSENVSKSTEAALQANLKELQLTTFEKYSEKYNELYSHVNYHLGRAEKDNARKSISALLGLFSQQLFIFQKGYIDSDLWSEWEKRIQIVTRKFTDDFEREFNRSKDIFGEKFREYYESILIEIKKV